MIITKPFQLTPLQHFQISLKYFFKKRWWFMAIFGVIALADLWLSNFTNFYFLVFLLFYIVFIVGYTWYFSHNAKNKIFFRKRWLEFDEKGFIHKDEVGTEVSRRFESLQTGEKHKDYYLLFSSPYEFFYVPFEVFEKTEDLESFDKVLHTYKLLR